MCAFFFIKGRIQILWAKYPRNFGDIWDSILCLQSIPTATRNTETAGHGQQPCSKRAMLA